MTKLIPILIVLGVISVTALTFIRRSPSSDLTHVAVSEHLVYVLDQLRHSRLSDQNIGMMSLSASGLGGRPDPSYLLYRYVASVATPPDLAAMLEDKSAVVRVVAAMVLLKERRKETGLTSADSLLHDREQIMAFDESCIPRRISVADVVAGLKKDPSFMDAQKAEPN